MEQRNALQHTQLIQRYNQESDQLVRQSNEQRKQTNALQEELIDVKTKKKNNEAEIENLQALMQQQKIQHEFKMQNVARKLKAFQDAEAEREQRQAQGLPDIFQNAQKLKLPSFVVEQNRLKDIISDLEKQLEQEQTHVKALNDTLELSYAEKKEKDAAIAKLSADLKAAQDKVSEQARSDVAQYAKKIQQQADEIRELKRRPLAAATL